jgi:hypothetical protein
MNIKASGRSALMVAAGIWLWCAGPLQAQETPNAAPPAAAQQTTQPNPLQQLFGMKPTPAAAPATEQPAAAEPGKPVALNKYRKSSSRHGRRHKASRSHRHSRRAAVENKAKSESKSESSAEAKTDAAADARIADADNNAPVPTPKAPAPLAASVANAKAQLLDATPTAGGAAPLTSAPATIADHASPTPATLNDGSPVPQPGAAAATEGLKNEAQKQATNNNESNPTAEAGVIPSDELNDVDRAMAAQAEPAPTLALASVHTPEPVTTGQAASASDENSSWAQASLIGKIFIAFGGLLTLASAVRMLIA